MSNFSAISWRDQVAFDEMMILSTFYLTNPESNVVEIRILKKFSVCIFILVKIFCLDEDTDRKFLRNPNSTRLP